MSWIVRANDLTQNTVTGEAIRCTKKALFGLASKKLALYWSLAIVSILIPVLHFFLVPAFFLVGILTFYKQFQNTHLIQNGSYQCPSCSQTSSLQNFYFKDETRLNCQACGRQIVIKEV